MTIKTQKNQEKTWNTILQEQKQDKNLIKYELRKIEMNQEKPKKYKIYSKKKKKEDKKKCIFFL